MRRDRGSVASAVDLDVHLLAIQAGDAQAFGRWASGAEGPLRASLRVFAASVDAEAIVQETLLRVWQAAPRVEPDGRPNALLRVSLRAARNLAVSELRRRRATPVEAEDIEALLARAEQADTTADPLLRQVISGCMEKLPGKPAEALNARMLSLGHDPDETLAERLGMRLNTFLQNVTRARKLLADCLRRHGVALDDEVPG